MWFMSNNIYVKSVGSGNQLAIYKYGQGFELGTTKNKSSKWPERELNAGLPHCESYAVTTQPGLPPDFRLGKVLNGIPPFSTMKQG